MNSFVDQKLEAKLRPFSNDVSSGITEYKTILHGVYTAEEIYLESGRRCRHNGRSSYSLTNCYRGPRSAACPSSTQSAAEFRHRRTTVVDGDEVD